MGPGLFPLASFARERRRDDALGERRPAVGVIPAKARTWDSGPWERRSS